MGVDVSVLVRCRPITHEDLPWVFALARRRYPNTYNEAKMLDWAVNKVLPNPHNFLAIRNERAFLVAVFHDAPWTTTCEVDIVFVCAQENGVWHALDCLRASQRWAEQKGASVWRLVAGGTDVNPAPFASRLELEVLQTYRRRFKGAES